MPTVIRAIGGAPKNWIATIVSDGPQGSGPRIQFKGHEDQQAEQDHCCQRSHAAGQRPGTPIGNVAPATATIPVPMTDARNQFGPMTTRFSTS